MSQKDKQKSSVTSANLQENLERVLSKINEKGGFKASIISTLDGLTLASVASEYDDTRISAISAIVQDVSEKAEKFIGFNRMDEVSLVDDDKFRLVCREFQVDGRHLILTVAVPPYKTYRKLTNDALREIQNIITGIKI